jgi:D-alanine-D-alanine ligase
MTISIGVIFGGRSGEHEISIRSAKTVIENIDRNRYSVVPIAISPEGRWLSPAESLQLFPGETRSLLSNFETTADPIALIGDTGYRGLAKFDPHGHSSVMPLDVIFPVLHGTFGEDGTIQGLLDMANIPYVGCGVLASSCGMDKVVMKKLFADAGLPICSYRWFLRSEWENDRNSILRALTNDLGFPSYVNPANLGSSLGVSPADDVDT